MMSWDRRLLATRVNFFEYFCAISEEIARKVASRFEPLKERNCGRLGQLSFLERWDLLLLVLELLASLRFEF